jgi:REP element-mobilizing transposase RayT
MASTLTNLLYHIVFSTKDREPLIVPALRESLYPYIGGIIRGERGMLLEIGGMPDHVHLVTRFKTDPSVATMIRTIKSRSSKWVNEQLNRQGRFSWQAGYGAFTVSASQVSRVRSYVSNQEAHHRMASFKDEYVALLNRHEIEYDERYLWD